MSTITDRRIGRFTVAVTLINEVPQGVRSVLSQVIILRAEYQLWNDSIEYVGVCDAFLALPEAAPVPTYMPLLRKEDDGTVVITEWKRQ